MTELTERDLAFIKLKHPLKKLLQNPTVNSPTLLYVLLEIRELNENIKKYLGIEEEQINDEETT